MTVKKIYVANDGTEFEDVGQCVDYEAKIRTNSYKNSALLFDAKGNPLPLTEQGFVEATFIRCTTDAAAQYLYNEFGEEYDNPWWSDCASALTAGCWYYDGERWMDVNALLEIAETAKLILS